MKICKATEKDLPEIRDLQYLAFETEAKLFKKETMSVSVTAVRYVLTM